MSRYIGEIVLFPYRYSPDGFVFCRGQKLKVQEYQALYSLLGNKFGSQPNITFKLPDLTGKSPVPDF